jgi:hypothetical protein
MYQKKFLISSFLYTHEVGAERDREAMHPQGSSKVGAGWGGFLTLQKTSC